MDTEPTKGQARRLQIVAAAIRCFGENGFHGSSMSQISEVAGMSVGHIYHYYPGKEALIEAIVEVKLGEAFERMDNAVQRGNLFEALVAPSGHIAETCCERGERALWMEILAEAYRNPKIAALMHKADARVVGRQREIFRQLEPADSKISDEELLDRLAVFNSVLHGLPIRLLLNPVSETSAMRGLAERILQSLIAP